MTYQRRHHTIAWRILKGLRRATGSTRLYVNPVLLPLDGVTGAACTELCEAVDGCQRDLVAGRAAHTNRSSAAGQLRALTAEDTACKGWAEVMAEAIAAVEAHGIDVRPLICDGDREAELDPDYGYLCPRGIWLRLDLHPAASLRRAAE